MRKIFGILLLVGAVAITACGPSKQERAAEQARLDSIAVVEEQARLDSIEAVQAAAAAAAAAAQQQQQQPRLEPERPAETQPTRRGDTQDKDDEKPTRRGEQNEEEEVTPPSRRGS